MNFGDIDSAMITASAISLTGVTHSFTNGTFVWRTPQGPERWGWWASALGRSERGVAMSKAVAESRANRALEGLRDGG
jgi:hypothetical protein